MTLNDAQRDALTELINIGYARAAGALSDLTGNRITLEVPRVAIHSIDDVGPILKSWLSGEVASVHQVFSGPVSGNALLLMDQQAAVLLNSLLTGNENSKQSLDASAREALTEVGNIVLNACLGIFGNMLNVQITFTVPRLNVETIAGVLSSITVAREELHYALMIQTQFHIHESDVSGYLVIVMGVTSLDRLLDALADWEQRQLNA